MPAVRVRRKKSYRKSTVEDVTVHLRKVGKTLKMSYRAGICALERSVMIRLVDMPRVEVRLREMSV